MEWMIPVGIAVAVLLAILIWGLALRSGLRTLDRAAVLRWDVVRDALAARDAALVELLPRIRGAAADPFDALLERSGAARDATDPLEAARIEDEVQGYLREVELVARARRDLLADAAYVADRRREIECEDALQGARRAYNASVRRYNGRLRRFPTSVVGRVFGFEERVLYDVSDRAAIAEPPRIQF